MKVGFIADIHLQGGFESKEAKALEEAGFLFRKQQVGIVCVCGDIYEGVSTEEQRLVFKNFLERFSANNIPVIVLRGNHDTPKELLINHQDDLVHVFEKPGSITIKQYNMQKKIEEYVYLSIIPHFSAGAVALQSGNISEFGDKGTNLMVDILNKMYQDINNQEHPSLVLFHGTVSGAMLDNEKIPRTDGIHLPLSVLETLGVPVVGGHYHKKQNVGGKVWYPGSITRQTWGEYQDDKGVLIWEHNGENWLPEPEFHSLNPQPMVSVQAEFVDGKFIDSESKEEIDLDKLAPEGTKLRFRYSVKKEEVHNLPSDLKEKLQAIDPTAKIEKRTITAEVVRNKEILDSTTVDDSLRVYYKGRGLADKEIDWILSIKQEILDMQNAQREEVAA